MAGNIHHFVSGYKEILMPGEGLTDGVLGNNFRLKSSVFGQSSKTRLQEEGRDFARKMPIHPEFIDVSRVGNWRRAGAAFELFDARIY